MDPMEYGQSFLDLMASMHQGEGNFLSRKASTERREVFLEAMSEQPEDSSTEYNTPHVISNSDALLSETENMYDSSASATSKRRKRRWAGTDLLMGNPKFASTIELAMKNADKRATANICQPYEGQSFDSLAEAYQFYNLHSWEAGFSIRHGTSQTNTKKDQRNMQEFECQRAGKPRENQKKTTRCGCRARMRLLRCSTGGYYLKTLVGEHNHSLVESCGEKRHLFSHKSIDVSTKEMIRHLRENNVSLSKVNCIMGSIHGSMSAVPFTKNCLRNVCAEIAQDHLQDDVQKTMQLFKELSKDDPNFRFSVQLDDDNKIKSLIWSSGRSRRMYSHFGDVVTFDTTYQTNFYDMPFGMFVGVNNHFQSVLFAGVLLTNEDTESYEWAFSEFLKLMDGPPPMTILTDQATAIAAAIREVYPETVHRWCKWHVLKDIRNGIGHVYLENKDFKNDFNKVVNHMLTKEEFKAAWADLIEKYNLKGNQFMERAYAKREMWAKPYFKDIFCARMTSTQRSECANHMVKCYVPRNASLHQFVTQYTKLTHIREEDDDEQQKNNTQQEIIPILGYPIVKHASQVYTISAYEMFMDEVSKSTSYLVSTVEAGKLYKTTHANCEEREVWCRTTYSVAVDNTSQKYLCVCGLSEHFRILCCHAISVMLHLGVRSIPDCHIMLRWTKKARDSVPAHLANYPDAGGIAQARVFRRNVLQSTANEIVKMGDSDNVAFEILLRYLGEAKQEILKVVASKVDTTNTLQTTVCLSAEDSCAGGYESEECRSSGFALVDKEANIVLSVDQMKPPHFARHFGRPSNKRYHSGVEGRITRVQKSSNGTVVKRGGKPKSAIKLPRYCRLCQKANHDSRTCPENPNAKCNVRKKKSSADCSDSGY